jgi:hypothetical protein
MTPSISIGPNRSRRLLGLLPVAVLLAAVGGASAGTATTRLLISVALESVRQSADGIQEPANL